MSDVIISTGYGSYNWAAPSEKQYQLGLRTPFGSVSEIFDEDHGLDADSGVEDVLCAIESRVNSYWASSSRTEKTATIAAIRARLPECELILARKQLALAEKKFANQAAIIERMKRCIEMLEADVAAVTP